MDMPHNWDSMARPAASARSLGRLSRCCCFCLFVLAHSITAGAEGVTTTVGKALHHF